MIKHSGELMPLQSSLGEMVYPPCTEARTGLYNIKDPPAATESSHSRQVLVVFDVELLGLQDRLLMLLPLLLAWWLHAAATQHKPATTRRSTTNRKPAATVVHSPAATAAASAAATAGMLLACFQPLPAARAAEKELLVESVLFV